MRGGGGGGGDFETPFFKIKGTDFHATSVFCTWSHGKGKNTLVETTPFF